MMENNDFFMYRKLVQNREANRERQYELNSGNRLAKILARKFDTANIGALASIEDNFGFLWGHGKTEEERTPAENEWYAKWQKLRKEILDKGNHQRRAATEELNEYTVVWNRYKKTLPVRGN